MKGICFKEELFKLVVSGKKTQTRRIINPRPEYNDTQGVIWRGCAYGIGFNNHKDAYVNFSNSAKPKYKAGERIYLKEPYRTAQDVDFIIYKYEHPTGRADYLGCDKDDRHISWKNKLFMPQSSARYFIEITAVRAERLQDISEQDCQKEGVIACGTHDFGSPIGVMNLYDIGKDKRYIEGDWFTPTDAYSELIDEINGKGTWESNPFVWVYDFRLVKD